MQASKHTNTCIQYKLFRTRFVFTGQAPDTDVMSSTVALHGSVVNRKAGRVFLVQEEEPARNRPISPEEEMINTAAAVLMLASYRNMSLHIFVRPALLATALHITKTTQKGDG